jgi:hypothetical protein
MRPGFRLLVEPESTLKKTFSFSDVWLGKLKLIMLSEGAMGHFFPPLSLPKIKLFKTAIISLFFEFRVLAWHQVHNHKSTHKQDNWASFFSLKGLPQVFVGILYYRCAEWTTDQPTFFKGLKECLCIASISKLVSVVDHNKLNKVLFLLISYFFAILSWFYL